MGQNAQQPGQYGGMRGKQSKQQPQQYGQPQTAPPEPVAQVGPGVEMQMEAPQPEGGLQSPGLATQQNWADQLRRGAPNADRQPRAPLSTPTSPGSAPPLGSPMQGKQAQVQQYLPQLQQMLQGGGMQGKVSGQSPDRYRQGGNQGQQKVRTRVKTPQASSSKSSGGGIMGKDNNWWQMPQGYKMGDPTPILQSPLGPVKAGPEAAAVYEKLYGGSDKGSSGGSKPPTRGLYVPENQERANPVDENALNRQKAANKVEYINQKQTPTGRFGQDPNTGEWVRIGD